MHHKSWNLSMFPVLLNTVETATVQSSQLYYIWCFEHCHTVTFKVIQITELVYN